LHINQSLAGSLHFFEDVGCGCGPDEGFGTFVVVIDIVFDGCDQLDHIAKNSTAQTVRGKVPKEAFDHSCALSDNEGKASDEFVRSSGIENGCPAPRVTAGPDPECAAAVQLQFRRSNQACAAVHHAMTDASAADYIRSSIKSDEEMSQLRLAWVPKFE
jgi:hypothetical protein